MGDKTDRDLLIYVMHRVDEIDRKIGELNKWRWTVTGGSIAAATIISAVFHLLTK